MKSTHVKKLSLYKGSLENADFQDECMIGPFEEKIDSMYSLLNTFQVKAEEICFVPNDSFSVVGADRELDSTYGYILFDREKPMSTIEKRNVNYNYYHLTFLGLDNKLFTLDWLKEMFHTIFNKIIQCETPFQLNSIDIVWMTIDETLFYKEMDKTFDIYDDRFKSESEYFAEAIVLKEADTQ